MMTELPTRAPSASAVRPAAGACPSLPAPSPIARLLAPLLWWALAATVVVAVWYVRRRLGTGPTLATSR